MEAEQNCDIWIFCPLLYFHWFQSWGSTLWLINNLDSTSSEATVSSCNMCLSTSNFSCMKHIYLFNYPMLRLIKVSLNPNTHNAIQRMSLKSVYVHMKCRTTSVVYFFCSRSLCETGLQSNMFKCALTDLLTWSTGALGSTYSRGDIKLHCCSLLIILFCHLH